MSNITQETQQYIFNLISNLLIEQHDHKEKREIKNANDRLNFACPYCGDSTVNPSKKRGNLYWDTLQYHCYNCGYHTNLYQFFKDYGLNIKNRNITHQIINHIENNKSSLQQKPNVLKHSGLKTVSELSITIQDFKRTFGAHEIKPGHWVWNYLKKRLLHKKVENFLFSPKGKRLWILNFDNNGYIIGAQSRKMNQYGSKYYTYDLIKLRKEIGLKTNIESDQIIETINKISTIFGIFQVNFQRYVTLFEGPIDAMFMNNSLGLASANRSTEEFEEIPTIRFLFDNDNTGKKKMIDKLKKGCYVFLWDSFINKFKLYEYNIKDFNDLIVVCYYNKPDIIKCLNNYFSNQKLDLWYL